MGSLEASETYDYIVCGGGTAGCVVAARLAEDPRCSILVVEAGKHSDEVPMSKVPGGAAKITGTDNDWRIETQPSLGINNRTIRVVRGKYLGGSSGNNGTLCIRGTRDDYDAWGIEGWSGDEFFKYMSKAETFHGKDWFEADEDAHGHDGPLHTAPHDLAPISKLIMQSFESQGMPYDADMFTTGKTSHGSGHATRTVYNGLRSTGADFLTNDYHRKNITIKTNVVVDRVILEQRNEKLTALGVSLVAADGTKSDARARKDVILSGGAYCTPPILLRSGIGPKEELEKFGIACQIDLPGVGRNLLDHLIVIMFYETEKEGLTNDYMVYHTKPPGSEAQKLYQKDRTGFLSTYPFGAFAYARLDDRLNDSPLWQDTPRAPGRDPMGLTPSQPNIEFFTTECYGGPSDICKQPPVDGKHAFAMLVELFSPRSKGTVTLISTDPMENPVVDHNYLDDPLDLLVLSEACRFGNEVIMSGKGTKDIVKGSYPSDLTHHAYTKREEWEQFVKNNATTCYHPGGTCAMGNSNNPNAVVGPDLRVYGVDNLRVADVSIMPTLNCGHTQMPAFAIGEKAADLIKGAKVEKNGVGA